MAWKFLGACIKLEKAVELREGIADDCGERRHEVLEAHHEKA